MTMHMDETIWEQATGDQSPTDFLANGGTPTNLIDNLRKEGWLADILSEHGLTEEDLAESFARTLGLNG